MCATQGFAESGIGNRESGIGNRESGNSTTYCCVVQAIDQLRSHNSGMTGEDRPCRLDSTDPRRSTTWACAT
ncbi:hypothetical protein C2859_07080 [Xanthomonas citri pv. glycines]|nr:hypothetical protein C2859_07080 [Xanthomonas citri pv. glycines]